MNPAQMLAPSALPNGFDNLPVDIGAIYAQHPLGQRASGGTLWKSPFSALYRSPLLPLTARGQLWTALHRANLDQGWFDRLRLYWARVLGGRPLWGPQDFHFLRNLYRMRFQSVDLPDTDDAAVHLRVWQKPEILHHLFHSVYKESLFHCLPQVQHLSRFRGDWKSCLEFGCGVAPVVTTLFEFAPPSPARRVFISDIETVPFHYAAWKFAEFDHVFPLPLRASDNFALPLDEKVDAIFCMAVFEHLQTPLEVVTKFHERLNAGGLLIFDYVLSEAGGLDTVQGLRERPRVLEFVERHFEIVHGALNPRDNMGVTVAVRR